MRLLLLLFSCLHFFSKAQTWNWARQVKTPFKQLASGSSACDRFGNSVIIGNAISKNDSAIISVFNHAGDLKWQRILAANIRDVVFDLHGNVIVAGVFSGSLQSEAGILNSNGDVDIFIRMFNYAGKEKWTKTFGGTGQDIATTIAAGKSGDIYIAGQYSQKINFDHILLVDSQSLFSAKLSNSGDIKWANQAPYTGSSATHVRALDLELDAIENIYLLTENSLLDCPYICTTFSLLKYSYDGNLLSGKPVNGSGENYVQDIAIDSAGNIFELWASGYHATNEKKLTKYDKELKSIWTAEIGTGYDGVSLGSGLTIGDDDRVYVTGWFGDTLKFYINIDTLVSRGKTDILVCEIDNSTGKILKSFVAGGRGYDGASGVICDKAGNIIVTGMDIWLPFLNIPDTCIFGEDTIRINSPADRLFIAKLKLSDKSYDEFIAPDTAVVVSNDFEVYPNPASQTMNIISKNGEPVQADLYDLTGRKIYSVNGSTRFNVDISVFQSGLYLLETNAGGEISRTKLLILH